MEIGKGQHQESFSRSFQHNGCDNEDDDDGHFVIALDESDQENDDELDGGTSTHALTENNADRGAGRGNCDFQNNRQSLTNKFFENIGPGINSHESNVSAQASVESSSLSLNLECTRDEDEQCRLDQSPTPDTSDTNDHPNVTLKVPNFLMSSPEIMKRLKSTLMERSTVSHDRHNTSSSSFYETESQEKTSDATRKLKFSPQDDCPCIMSHRGNSSKLVKTSEPINVTSSLELPDYSAVVSKNVASARNISICNASTSNVVSFASHKQAHSTLSHQSSLSNSNSGCSVKKPKVQRRKHQSSIAPLMTNNSGSSSSKSLLTTASKDFSLCRNVIVKQNGSYFVLFPQLPLQRHGHTILQKKIPELDTKEGKTLVLTQDFVTLYKPDLKALLMKSKKADFSNPGTVCFLMSNNEVSVQSSGTYILISPNASLPGCNTPTTLRQNNVTDILIKMIESHFKVNDNATTSMISRALMASQIEKHPPVSKVMDVPWSCSSLNSNLNASTSSRTVRDSNILLASKVSDSPQQSSTSSRLPPPPPLVRCPRFPVASPKTYSVLGTRTSNSTTSPCVASTTAFPPLISIASDSVSHAISPISAHVYEEPSRTLSNDVVTSVSRCTRGHTPPVLMPDSPFSIDAHTDHREVEEDMEVLVIPVVNKHKSTEKENDAVTVNSAHAFANPEPAPFDPPQVESSSSLQNIVENRTVSVFESVTSVSQKSCNQSSMSTVATTLSSVDRIPSSIVYTSSLSNISQYMPDVPFGPPEVKCENTASQLPAVESFPSVVKVNLSSCANFSYASPTLSSRNCPSVSTTASYSMLPAATTSSNISSNCDLKMVSCSKSALSSSLDPSLLTQNPSSQCFQMHKPAILSTSSAFRSRRKQSFHGITSSDGDFAIISPNPLSDGSTNKILLSDSENHLTFPSTSTSSVSVNGLKLKIRLGDAKNASSIGNKKSGKLLNNANASQIKRNVSGDQIESVKGKTSSSRIETAEEMFQRFQEQAMREVYNAQFGVGNVSRSLRPSRSNISFVDRNIHLFRLDDGKTKTSEDNSGTSKATEDSKKNRCTNESLLKAPEYNCTSPKSNKKQHFSSDSCSEFPTKEHQLDINDFPKLREDDSILVKKNIFTPNIMAGHQVFVKFNVFSNQQSGRSFLIPFFNLGGSRVQFDFEDMEYIKRSVIDVEKGEKFCARHLIYDSRVGKKASFLRKEHLAQTSDLSEKSYRSCSYILEGFSREPTKKVIPVPEEWKVDKKVSIEIDTADVDSNVVIDFEDSLAYATVKKDGGKCSSQVTSALKAKITSDSHNVVGSPVTNDARAGKKATSKVCSYDTQDKSCCNIKEATGVINENVHTVDLGRKPIVPTANTHSPFNGEICNNNPPQNAKSSSTSSSPFNLTMINTPSVSTANYTDQLQELLSSGVSPTSSDRTLKSTKQDISADSAISYTDQLKELFSSGNMHDTIPSTSMSGHLGDFNQEIDNDEWFVSQIVPCTSIKQEILDEEFMQSSVPSSQTYEDPVLSDTRDSSSLSAANLKIKPEPIDTDFDSVGKSTMESPSTNIMPKGSQICSSTSELHDLIDSTVGTEDGGRHLDERIKESSTKTSEKFNIDEDTLSAFSSSPLSSSSVSESSEISSSSSIDTSDEGTGDDLEDDNALSASSVSFIGTYPTLSRLLSNNLPQNPNQTKITSLVESLKQRLSKNTPAAIPSIFTEPLKQPKVKVKRQKRTLKRRRTSHKPLTLKNSTGTSYNDQIAEVVDNDDKYVSENPSLVSHLPVASTLISRTSKSTLDCSSSSNNRSDFSVVAKQKKIDAIGSDGDLTEFRRRFPFITSAKNVDAKNLKDSGNIQTQVLTSAPDDQQPGDCSDQGAKARNSLGKDVDLLAFKHTIVTELPRFSSESNGILASAPNNDDHFDSESDIDVGTEDVIHDNLDINSSQGTEFLSTSPLSIFGRSHMRYSAQGNENVMPKTKQDDKSIKGSVPPKRFTLPIRPRNKTRAFKPKPPYSKVTAPPSTASLLCQKLDISIESIAPKLKGKVDVPSASDINVKVQEDKLDSFVSHEHVPKPINPGFKPSINAIFGVPDIPKSLETIINRSNSSKSKRAVAKKSSIKNNFQIHRQVAKKRTMGNVLRDSKNVKVQKIDKIFENETKVNHESVPSADSGQFVADFNVKIIDAKLQKPEIMTQLESKSLSPDKHAKNQSKKKEIHKESAQRSKPSSATKQGTMQGVSQRKAKLETDSNIKSTHESLNNKIKSRFGNKELNNKSKPGVGSKEVNNKSKSGVGNKEMNSKGKSGVANKKLSSKSKLVAAKFTLSSKSDLEVSNKTLSKKGKLAVTNKALKNKSESLVTNKKPKNNNKLRVANKALNKSKLEVGKKKLNINAKKGLVNRKLGTLLIEVNRYSSLRKFAWRKYSNIKEKIYIAEAGDEDFIPAIVDGELSNEEVKQNCANKNDDDGKGIMELYGVKPCMLLLCKLEDTQWDSKEVPVKTESGTYIIKHSQESEKRLGAPEMMKKRKKKSALQRHKKGAGRPKTVKKDIVDYYAAAIESLRKKALLLEEDEKQKAEKVDSETRLVIKQEDVESPEYNENEETVMASSVDGGSDEMEDSLQCGYNDEKCFLIEGNGLKKNDSLKESSTHTNTNDTEITNNDVFMALEKNNYSSVKPLTGPESTDDPENEILSPQKLANTSENQSEASLHCIVKSDRKTTKIAERNYEGALIQTMLVAFQDQDDIEENSDSDVSMKDTSPGDRQEYVVADFSQGENRNEAEVSSKRARAKEVLSVGNVMDTRCMDSPEVVESAVPDYEGHCSKNIALESVKETDAQNGQISKEFIQDIEQMSGYNADNNATNVSSASEACGSRMDIMECDNSCNKIEVDRKLPIFNVNQDNREKNESAPHVSNECNRNGPIEMSGVPDCSFIHKDIVLGFEDELGTNTVFSKLAVGGEDDMFLLGDEDDDDEENIGLIPDEEVERLLGLDKKEGESENDSSTVKRNGDRTLQGGADSNIDKLRWTLLPEENRIIVNESKNTRSDPEKLEQRDRIESEQLNLLTIDTHPAGDISISRSDLSPERPTPSTDNKSAEISPSWKRILGSKALKEIEESVSSSIATSSVNEFLKNQESNENKFKSRLQADKLKLCTGALSKALKLSAEMRKTFGDSSSDVDQKNGNKTTACSVKSQEEIQNNKNDGGSFVNIANSIVSFNKSTDDHKDMYSLNDCTLGNADIRSITHENISMATISQENSQVTCHGDRTGGIDTTNKESPVIVQEANEGLKRVIKTFGKNVIDLSKLKMKLTPILASARVKSAAADIDNCSVQEEDKGKIQSSIFLPASETKEQGLHQKQQAVSGTSDVKKTVLPLLNTEKLTNILKNFKKPLKLNLTSKSTKTCSNLSGPSLTPSDANASDFKTQNVPNKKSPTRKRTHPSHHNNPIESKRSKLTVTEISSSCSGSSTSRSRSSEMEISKDSEDEKAGRSCFDCLSEVTPSG